MSAIHTAVFPCGGAKPSRPDVPRGKERRPQWPPPTSRGVLGTTAHLLRNVTPDTGVRRVKTFG
jgi:hypothetical protein